MTWQFSGSTRESSPENTVGKSSSWQAKSNMGLLAFCLNPRMWIAEIHWGPASNSPAFSHCCIMTNNNKYWAGLSPSTSPWRWREDIYSLGWCLTSKTDKSGIPPGFCPLSPNISYLWNLMCLSTSPSSFFHIHLCFTIAPHSSLCSSPSLTSSLESSEHSFQCCVCCPFWSPICTFLILPHNHSGFSFGLLYSHLFFAVSLFLQPRKALRLC